MKEYKAVGTNFKSYYYYTNEAADRDDVKGVIVIAPGIEGTGSLYDEIGEDLDSKGYALYTLDEWGYGKTGMVDKKNFYKNWKYKTFHFASYNIHALSTYAKSKHPNVPLYLIGNDFGAMLSLYLIREFPDVVDKVVTIGWGAPKLQDYGFLFTSLIRKIFLFDDGESKLAHFGKNKSLMFRFEKGEKYAWLSSDLDQVKKIKDAGYIDTAGTVGHYFFYYARKVVVPYYMLMKKTDRNTPLLFVSGTEDLTTRRGFDTKRLAAHYKLRKFTNVESMMLNGRHEVLFEKSRLDNMDMILKWLETGVAESVVKNEEIDIKDEKTVEIQTIISENEEKVLYQSQKKEVVDLEQKDNDKVYSFMEAEEDLLIKTQKEQ